ncbi:mechanosensitive ion channel family protein [Bizionia argentinensis JUB59]|uniref:Mechanosensitive ion channel family protein n=1 Tax=Bizionia argentinensis JUB59 TaxID=1046627 RepID=G2E9J8_9FLAO|nr:mechanosensitive ion channel family protein [Bizionia argentinensis]EGV44766.2 mechanosensitive ion channel family protein [Bizionia argentinensis JUB59]
MIDFFKENSQNIYILLGLTALSIVLYIAVNKISRTLKIKAIEKGYSDFTTIKIVRKIIKTCIVLFYLFAVAYLLADKSEYNIIANNIKKTTYLIFVFVLTSIAYTISNGLFNRIIERKDNPTTYKFLKYVAAFIIIVIGIAFAAMAFPSLKSIASTALGGAGIIAAIIGLASQEALANIIGGFFIIMFKPFQVYDTIKISGEMVGTVTDITLRHTLIRDYHNKMIVVPNAIINKEKIVNYNLGDQKYCQYVEFSISYDSDIELAKRIMQEECENHPSNIDVRTKVDEHNKVPKVQVRVISLEDSHVALRAWVWTSQFGLSFAMKCDLLESIKNRFDTEGIEIPYPYRTIITKFEKAPASDDTIQDTK